MLSSVGFVHLLHVHRQRNGARGALRKTGEHLENRKGEGAELLILIHVLYYANSLNQPENGLQNALEALSEESKISGEACPSPPTLDDCEQSPL